MKLLESLASAIPALANTDAICRIHPGLQKSPFVIHCQSPKQWVQKILEEKPYQTRNSLQQYPLAPELLGKPIYQFLKPGK